MQTKPHGDNHLAELNAVNQTIPVDTTRSGFSQDCDGISHPSDRGNLLPTESVHQRMDKVISMVGQVRQYRANPDWNCMRPYGLFRLRQTTLFHHVPMEIEVMASRVLK